MAHYENDVDDLLENDQKYDTPLNMTVDEHWDSNEDTIHSYQTVAIDDESPLSDAEDAESDYSIDYDYLGPRNPNYRAPNDADSDASELSDTEPSAGSTAGFDMWDEDPYSTNDYTWDSNDMRLTHFVKKRKKKLEVLNSNAPWQDSSFWKKQKGWPRQLPFSNSTTNHDQSANAMCLVQSNYGFAEQLYAVYRDRIVECGREPGSRRPLRHNPRVARKQSTTWIDSDPLPYIPSITTQQEHVPQISLSSSSSSSSSLSLPLPLSFSVAAATTSSSSSKTKTVASPSLSSSPASSSLHVMSPTLTPHSKFVETHYAVSLPRSASCATSARVGSPTSKLPQPCISKFVPFTKYIKRKCFPPIFREDAYVALEFEPLCLARNYGYMAIGGIEGEFELYCCMDDERPVKIWGTNFKSKNNIMLMTNAVQIVRWRRLQINDMQEYDYMLIACMNEAGILIYKLPSHKECQVLHTQYAHKSSAPPTVQLHSHLRYFDQVPINDAQVSPDGTKMVCVGDDSFVFMIDIIHDERSGVISFGSPSKLAIPEAILHTCSDTSTTSHTSTIAPTTYSSQYVAWSKSSRHFAHTSDSHTNVLVWRAETREILYSIDAAGYTYAIKFHPLFEGVLAFTSRYGYFQTVNLEEATPRYVNKTSSVLHFDQQSVSFAGHICQGCTVPKDGYNHAVYHTQHLHARHEITMVAFRGERDPRLRILAKINGIQWSKDGRYLYVSTKKRVLAYQFMPACTIRTLMDVASQSAREILENSMPARRRKRKRDSGIEQDQSTIKRFEAWHKKWLCIPAHIRYKVLGESQLASHW
ncbi:hypothetical protein EC973_008233 [Apophysomyces ossiformis]|uniref:Uncharacterized protein n=1 Tax=Apophysomyces ossiformis TaxID=679940 RepID=A0A8H7BTP7_9FUNG|nr:hypothetical protein EC973_008233 [Apophysomyces ossiformis]